MRRVRRGEEGFAMIATIIVITVAAMLAAVILTEGSNADHNSGRDKNWTVALHVADAGVEKSIAYLQVCLQNNAPASCPGPPAGTTNEGSYATSVTYLGRNRFQIDSTGNVGTVSSLKRHRNLRVILAPPPSFKYALFSNSDINTKNNDVINGDVWANGSVEVFQNDSVNGSVDAATGWVHVDMGSCVSKNVHSGGSVGGIGIQVDGGNPKQSSGSTPADGCESSSNIGGNATASSSTPACLDDPGHNGYQVANNGSIAKNAVTWSKVAIGGTVGGGRFTKVCTLASAVKPMPTIQSFNPANYSPPGVLYTSVAAFQAYVNLNKAAFQGAFEVQGPGVIDLSGVQIAGDTTIVATDPTGTGAQPTLSAAIDSNGLGAANNNDKILVLYSAYQPPSNTACESGGGNPGDCAIGMKNNFSITDNTATLLYAPNGPCLFKNNATFDGAVYCSNIIVKNNQTVTYDTRVEQIVGFGPVTLQIDNWQERKG